MAMEAGISGGIPGNERVGYAGRPGLIGLLSKNYFLTLVTLGVYRFWAATRLRRYLWSNIQVGGDGLEYTGTGRELFLGFLVAMAVILPLSIVYVVANRLSLGNPTVAGTLHALYFLALFVFLQVALFRSRRYRLSRTAWRGIRAGQTGSTWHYLGLYLGYGVLTVITLSLALPWMNVALERYKLNNTWFGDHEIRVEARGRDLLWRWLVVMAFVIVPVAVAILPNLNALLHPVYVEVPPVAPQLPPTRHLQLPHAGLLAFLALAVIGGGLALVWYRIEAFRYLASRTSLGGMRLHSKAKGSSAVGQVLLFGLGLLGIGIATGIVFMVLGGMVATFAKAFLVGKTINPLIVGIVFFAVLVPFYIVFFYIFRLISYCWLWIPILRHIATTLTIENFAAVQDIAQSQQPRQKLGIADSFELGAI